MWLDLSNAPLLGPPLGPKCTYLGVGVWDVSRVEETGVGRVRCGVATSMGGRINIKGKAQHVGIWALKAHKATRL